MTFWEAAAKVEPAHWPYLNHIMACQQCRAAVGRYCEEGRRLKAEYERAWLAVSDDSRARLNPAHGQAGPGTHAPTPRPAPTRNVR